MQLNKMPRHSIRDHKNPQLHTKWWVLTILPSGSKVYRRAVHMPQNRIWVEWLDGRRSVLWQCPTTVAPKEIPQSVWRAVSMAIARRQSASGETTQAFTAEPCALGKKYQNVLAFLVDTLYADGQDRTPGSLTIFKGTDGSLRLCLNDKDLNESAFITASSLTELLRRADEGIASGSLDWREQKARPTRKRN